MPVKRDKDGKLDFDYYLTERVAKKSAVENAIEKGATTKKKSDR